MAGSSIEQHYKGYRLSCDADPVSNHAHNWYATGRMGKSTGQLMRYG